MVGKQSRKQSNKSETADIVMSDLVREIEQIPSSSWGDLLAAIQLFRTSLENNATATDELWDQEADVETEYEQALSEFFRDWSAKKGGQSEKSADIFSRITQVLDRESQKKMSDFTSRYMSYVDLTCREFKGLANDTSSFIPHLSDIYVSPVISTSHNYFQDGENVTQESEDSDSIWEIISESRRRSRNKSIKMLVVASAGSGKSTLLRYIAHTYSTKAYKKYKTSKSIPVLIQLRQYSDILCSHNPPNLADFITEKIIPSVLDASLRGAEMPHSWVRENLNDGRLTLLMDGVDEVRNSDRLSLTNWLFDQFSRYERNDFIVTSRPNGIPNKNRIEQNFDNVLYMHVFSNKQREKFLLNWYFAQESLARGGGETQIAQTKSLEYVRSLQSEIERNSDLKALASNPMLLTAMAALYRAYGSPETEDPGISQPKWLRAFSKWRTQELLEKVHNPYVAGNPVRGRLFVGRDDILSRIEELWTPQGQLPSIILYGHRRMGKTSILQNLEEHLGSNTQIVDFNMQRVGIVESTGELLYNLAVALFDSLPEFIELKEPNEDSFIQHTPYTAFDRFLKKLDNYRNQTRYIVTVDEFELVEHLIQAGKIEQRILGYWRSLIVTYPWFIMAFAGLHSLQEMTEDYWSPLFGNVIAVPVSFLSVKATQRLITNPSDDFSLDYERNAVEVIYKLTAGQPYLIQLICHCLVSRFNRQRFEEGMEIEPRLGLADVETIITSPNFYRDGNAYFSGVWSQAQESCAEEQAAILQMLCQQSDGLSAADLEQRLEARHPVFLKHRVSEALSLLQRHDVISLSEDRYTFVVELMRRWVEQEKLNE